MKTGFDLRRFGWVLPAGVVLVIPQSAYLAPALPAAWPDSASVVSASAAVVTPEPTVIPVVASPGACPEGMVKVVGNYCPNPQQECLRWLDNPTLPFARCGEYASPSRCFGERVPLSFCISRYEYSEPGADLPSNWLSFTRAAKACAARRQRLCTEDEWNFACEGEQMLPYPYGYKRQAVCNQDRGSLVEMKKGSQVLRDLRQPHASLPECKSPFGVYNMVGNVDEPVVRSGPRPPNFNVSLKGGWWMAGRNRCRPATRAHDDYFTDVQIGARCCADLPITTPEAELRPTRAH